MWCNKRNGGTKSRGWTFPDGTVCQTSRNRYRKPSYCINGKCELFSCGTYDETMFAQMPELCPNERDDNEIIFRNSLHRQENKIVRWKSVSGCHFNCVSPGTGVRLVMSKGKYPGRSSIQLCQPDQYVSVLKDRAYLYASNFCLTFRRVAG